MKKLILLIILGTLIMLIIRLGIMMSYTNPLYKVDNAIIKDLDLKIKLLEEKDSCSNQLYKLRLDSLRIELQICNNNAKIEKNNLEIFKLKQELKNYDKGYK